MFIILASMFCMVAVFLLGMYVTMPVGVYGFLALCIAIVFGVIGGLLQSMVD